MEKVKLFITDVDGVLTDGKIGYTTDNEGKLKYTLNFNKKDSRGFEILRDSGVDIFVITSESKESALSPLDKRIYDLNFKNNHIIQLLSSVKDKLQLVIDIIKNREVSLHEVAYIGDDESDVNCLKIAGFSYVPNDSFLKEQDIPRTVRLNRVGGNGCIFESVNDLKEKGLL